MKTTPFIAQCVLILSSFEKIDTEDKRFYLIQQRLYNNAFCCLVHAGFPFRQTAEHIIIETDKEYIIPISVAKNIMGNDVYNEIVTRNESNDNVDNKESEENNESNDTTENKNTDIHEEIQNNKGEVENSEANEIDIDITPIENNISDKQKEIEDVSRIVPSLNDFASEMQYNKNRETFKVQNLQKINEEKTEKTPDKAQEVEKEPKKVFMPKKLEHKKEETKEETNVANKFESIDKGKDGFIPKIEHNITLKARYSNEQISGYKITIFPLKILSMTTGFQSFRGLIYFEAPDGDKQLQFKSDTTIEITFKSKDKEFGVTGRWNNNIIETSVFTKGDTYSKYELVDDIINNCKYELTRETISPFRLYQKGRPEYFVFPLNGRNTLERTVPVVSCIKNQNNFISFMPAEDGCIYYSSRGIKYKITGSWQGEEFKFSIDEAEIE